MLSTYRYSMLSTDFSTNCAPHQNTDILITLGNTSVENKLTCTMESMFQNMFFYNQLS